MIGGAPPKATWDVEIMGVVITQVAPEIATRLLSFSMEIYLDYNATAPLLPASRAAVEKGLDLLNPSSVHGFGRAARQAVTESRNRIAEFLSVRSAQVIFTSGATESIATALHGAGRKNFIIGATEHDAVRANANGAKIIPVDTGGVIDLNALENILQKTSDAMIALQYVNNETGVIQPAEQAIELAKQYNALIMIDAVQALGKLDLSPIKNADMIALSAHKIGGPKGVGALVLRDGLSIQPLMLGGGQEERRRAGTENVAAIMGFGAAVEDISVNLDKQKTLAVWRDAMEKEIASAMPPEKYNLKIFNGAARAANTSMIALANIPAATQLMNLDLAGIAVSSGSACSSGKVGPSHTLIAMGVDENTAASAIRISSGWNTSEKDYQEFVKAYLEMARRLK